MSHLVKVAVEVATESSGRRERPPSGPWKLSTCSFADQPDSGLREGQGVIPPVG